MLMDKKKKQGDPQRTPRSPWGIPPREQPPKGKEQGYQEKRSQQEKSREEKEKDFQRANSFLRNPHPKGMLNHLEEIRQRPFPGRLRPVNIGQESLQKPKQRFSGVNGISSKDFSKPQDTNGWLKNTFKL
jgi:hypothetical protein